MSNLVIPTEGKQFLDDLDCMAVEEGIDVLKAWRDGKMSYALPMMGGVKETFPQEGLYRVINLVVRNTGSLNRNDVTTPLAGTITVSGSGTTPITVTCSTAHGLATGDRVKVSGQTGNTNANGVWTITLDGVSPTTKFSLDNSVALANASGTTTVDVIAGPLGATTSPQYVRLFTSPTGGDAVPSDNATLSTGSAGAPTGTTPVVEATGSAYTGCTILASSWPAPSEQGSAGQRSTVTGTGVSFTPSGGSWGTVWGFFLATTVATTQQYGGIALFYANFDDGQSIAVNASGYTVRVAPFIEFDH